MRKQFVGPGVRPGREPADRSPHLPSRVFVVDVVDDDVEDRV